MSKGENISIRLQEYFKDANSARIIYENSTANIDELFVTSNTSSHPYREVYTQSMEYLYKGTKIKLSEVDYYAVKALYNQPVKLFLLRNNFILLHIYKEHCGASNDNSVHGLNLTEKLPILYRGKKINCTSMEVQASF